MATVTTRTEFRPFHMNIDRYQRLVDSGVYGDRFPIFLWNGRLVEKIREGFEPTPDGYYPEHRMSSDRFMQLVDAEVFGADDKIFLWRGSLVEKMSKGRPHSFAALKLDRLIDRLLPEEFHVELEQPLKLSNDSVPEPDLMILRGSLNDYRKRVPESHDVILIVEVADSSLSKDQKDRLQAYAAEAIPFYWVVNISNGRIEVYSQPTGSPESPAYQDRRDYSSDDEIPIVLDGLEIGRIVVKDVLP